RFLGYRGTTRDITEHKRAAEELSAAKHLLDKTFASLSDALLIVDAKTRKIVSCNPAAVKIFGYGKEEMLGNNTAFLHKDRAAYEEFGRKLFAALDKDGEFRAEFSARRKDGSIFDTEHSVTEILDETGRRSGLISIMRDITERKEAEARLIQAQKMEAVGQLTGGVAHDFNNLLAVMSGNTELLAGKLGSDDKSIQAILRASDRGAALTQRLLAFSRQQPLRPKPIDLQELAEGMSGLLKRTLGEAVEIETMAEADLWTASADPSQVENALLNLAINARDAMPGGGKLTIACKNCNLDEDYVALKPEADVGDYVVLTVTDTGVGMSAEVQAHAFEPFFTTKAVGQGSGLGLSMIYGFARQSGGYLSICSKEGRGTTVRLYLPRSSEVAKTEEAQPSEEVPRGRGEAILVVEDDANVRTLAVKMLKELGYHVREAADATEAREALAKGGELDLVLSDVILPGGTSGLELAGEARARQPRLKFVFMSGYSPEAGKYNGLLGADKVLLNKPFRRCQLARFLREAIDRGPAE
ncbi:MAG: PAS domain S-box protein, partial [Rhodospirillales bacterium]|nr:PAS domain S-box protein [Rhodospirillales bacterium]